MSSMTVTFPGGKRVDAEYNGFTIKTDQSPKGGGEGSAPQPFDLFLASIATCAGIYVKGYCDTRGIPTESLGLQMHIAVGIAFVPGQVLEMGYALQSHHDSLESVGDLDRDGLERLAAGLLEVGELGDLLAVQPDFPSETPGPERRRLPVVFDETDIVAEGVDPQSCQRVEVDLLRIPGVWFQDDLELVVLLHAVGVFAVAAVGRSA